MVTRSIVGRVLILAVLLVSLGVIAQAAMIITKDSGRKVVAKADAAQTAVAPLPAASTPAPSGVMAANAAPAPAVSAPAVAAPAVAAPAVAAPAVATLPGQTAQPTDAAPVRVVYPGPLGDAPMQLRKIADAAPASPLPQPAPPVAVVTAQPLSTAQPVAAAQVTPAVQVASADAGAQPAADAAPSGKGINLNSASVDALNHLGGGHIGQSIVQHRPYRSVEDLVKKRVVRRSVYEQIKNQVAAE